MVRKRIAIVPLALLLVSACASEEPSAPLAETPIVETSVAVDLSEWTVLLDPPQVQAGTVTFEVSNVGTEVHELVILAADGREPGELPTLDDGSVDEDQIEVLTEAEDIAPDASDKVHFDLDAGSYILFCNVVADGDVHYKLGMRTGFTVT